MSWKPTTELRYRQYDTYQPTGTRIQLILQQKWIKTNREGWDDVNPYIIASEWRDVPIVEQERSKDKKHG